MKIFSFLSGRQQKLQGRHKKNRVGRVSGNRYFCFRPYGKITFKFLG